MKSKFWAHLFLAVVAVSPPLLQTYYLEPTKAHKSLSAESAKADQVLMEFIINKDKSLLALEKKESSFILRPQIMRSKSGFTIKIKKLNGKEKVISTSIEKAAKPKDLDSAINKAMIKAMGGKAVGAK